MTSDELSNRDLIKASLTKKAVIDELNKYDELTYECYKKTAHKTLLSETKQGTADSKSYWIKYNGAFYPLKMIGRMASLKGGYKSKGYPEDWKHALDHLRKTKGLKIELLHDPDITLGMAITETKTYKWHRKIEGRQSLRKFLEILGYKCKACGKELKPGDNDIWKSTFEVHHLEPFSGLEIGTERKQTKEDFAVLCSCCHRAIHRTKDVSDIKGFRKKYFKK